MTRLSRRNLVILFLTGALHAAMLFWMTRHASEHVPPLPKPPLQIVVVQTTAPPSPPPEVPAAPAPKPPPQARPPVPASSAARAEPAKPKAARPKPPPAAKPAVAAPAPTPTPTPAPSPPPAAVTPSASAALPAPVAPSAPLAQAPERIPPAAAPPAVTSGTPSMTSPTAPSQASTPVSIPARYATGNRKPVQPAASRRYGEEGTVRLRVLVRTDGSAQTVEIKESSGFPMLDDAARSAVQDWRFEPATRNGKPVAEWHVVPITFTLRN